MCKTLKLSSPEFVDGLPTDRTKAVHCILKLLQQYARDASAPPIDPAFIADVVGRLPPDLALPADRWHLPCLVLLLIRYSGMCGATEWIPLMEQALEDRFRELVTDSFDLFQGGTGQGAKPPRFRPASAQAAQLGMVIDFDRVAQAPEMSIPLIAQNMARDIMHIDGCCKCYEHVVNRERARSKAKCTRQHDLLEGWERLYGKEGLKKDWRKFYLWLYVDNAVLGFPIPTNQKPEPVTFKSAGFWSGMLAYQTRRFLRKANVVEFECSGCGRETSIPCDQIGCPLRDGKEDLPLVGKKDWIIVRPTAKCHCGRLLAEDELGKPCPECGEQDYARSGGFFEVVPLWRCPECSRSRRQDRFFFARRCLEFCPPDGNHDQCPVCHTEHRRGSAFKVCYWHMYRGPGPSPSTGDDTEPPAPQVTVPTAPQIRLRQYEADLRSGLNKTATNFALEEWRHHICILFARDILWAVMFLYHLHGEEGKGLSPTAPTADDYRELFNRLSEIRAIEDLPLDPYRLQSEWDHKAGPIVTTWLRHYLGSGSPPQTGGTPKNVTN